MDEKSNLGLVTLSAKDLKTSDILTRNGILDIVAVHGLCGDRETSWSDQFEVSWLQDLPFYLAHARVSTYGYKLNGEGVSATEIDEKAKELLDTFCNGDLADTYYPRTFIFIGHNLGGCIIKQALLRANIEPIYSSIAKRTSLVMFFGTPQRAETQAEWETLAHNLIHATGQETTAPQSEILMRTSFALRDVNERYAKLARTYTVMSICENVKLESFGKLVFDKHVSTLGVPNETVVTQEADHMSICKVIGNDETGELFSTICEKMATSLSPDSLHIDCLLTLSSLVGTPSTSLLPLTEYSEPNWILAENDWLKFIGQEHGILQLCGKTGSGLSVLSSFLPKFVTDSIKLRDSNTSAQEIAPDPIVISYVFNSYDYRTCSTFALFAALTHQLLGVDPGYFRYIRHIYERISKKDWSLENLWVLFRSTILGSAVRLTYCIIDSMNDCDPDRDHFLGDFLQLARSPEAKLKIILTNTTGNPQRFSWNFSINVDELPARQKELIKYFEDEILELTRSRPGFQSISSGIRTEIPKVLAKDPSFLFTSLLFRYFHDNQTRSTPAEMESVLATMPLTSTDIYHMVFVPPTASAHWKFKALSWIAYAFRPLSLDELATALAIEYSCEILCVDKNKRPHALKEDLKRAFGCFLDIHEDKVLLVHGSARDFLLQSAKDWDYADWDGAEIHSGQKDNLFYGHSRLAGICIDYLQNATWEEVAADAGNSNLESLPATDGNSSLFSYAARYWYVHYKLAGKLKSQILLDKARRFLEDEKRRTLWAHVEWLEGNRLATSRNTSDPLNIAAELGLNDVLLSMIDARPEKSGTYIRVIAMAAQRGDLDLLKDLQRRGIVTTDSDPLRLAAEKGHLGVVKYLLENYVDGDPNTLRESKEAALHAAAQSGYDQVVEELLKSDVNASAVVNEWTPLHRAAELGNLLICSRLLKKETNVDVNAATTNDQRSTPLHLATLSGQLSTIRFLLNSTADIDSKDSKALRPLHQAAASGLVDAVDLLLSRDAPIGSIGDEGQTALHVAVDGNHTRSVQALLDGDADTNVETHNGSTPLHLIARNGNLEIAKIFLAPEYGTKLSHLDNNQESPLHIAARYGYTSLVQLLIDHDPDIVESDASIETLRIALTLAAKNGGFGVVRAIISMLRNYEDLNDDLLYDEPLLAAAIRGNIKIVDALLREGARPIRDDQAFSALHSAAESGDDGVISALLIAGLYLGDDPTEEITPLHPAVESGSLKAVRLLLSANADVDIPDPNNGKTPLLKAASLGYTDIVNVLLDAGAEVTVSEDTGSSFLHCAIEAGSIEIFDLAFVSEDDVLTIDNSGFLPLHIAAIEGFVYAASKLLESKSAIEQAKARTSDKDRTALHLASKHGSIEIVELLLKVDDDINIMDTKELTPLHLASKKGHLGLVKFLLGKEANPNLTDNLGRTPLFIAFERGEGKSEEIIHLLRPKTLDLKAVDKSDNTLLHIASKEGMLQEVQILMSLGLDIEARNSDKRTPLSLAAESGQLETCKRLLQADANFNYLDDDGETVLSRAVSSGNKKLVMLLLEKGAEPELEGTRWPALYTAAYCRDTKLVREFLSLGFDKEKRGGSLNWTPLHACYDSPEVTSILIEAGASTDVVDSDGYTLMDLAAERWQPDTVEVYLKYGLDPLKPRSRDGKTPMHIAVGAGSASLILMIEYAKAKTFDIKDNEGHTPLQLAVIDREDTAVEVLLGTSKCQVSQVDSDGKTLLSLAAVKKYWEIIRLLIENGAEVEPSQGEELLKAAAGSGRWGMIELLLEKGAEAEEPLSQKLLKEAMINTNEKVAELISKKAPHLIDRLLGEATEEENLNMIEQLLSRVDRLEPAVGNEILLLAARNGSLSLIDTLLGNWATYINPNTEDEHGWTPYMLAQALQYDKVRKRLQTAQEDPDFITKTLEPLMLGDIPQSMPLEMDKSKLVVRNTVGKAMGDYDKFTVFADHPISIFSKSFYFEIEVLEQGETGVVGIGIASRDTPRSGMPGWNKKSWAFHGDDGHIFDGANGGRGRDYADQTYGKDDIVGCFYDLERSELSFIYNGVKLGTAFQNVWGCLFPVIGLGKGTKLKVNFGENVKYKEFMAEKERSKGRRR